jgi:hypothetical protein
MPHGATPYRAALPGVMAMRLHTAHSFPRHAHDHFGIGVMTAGAQRSWSGRGAVESALGDIITVNPGEMHDGAAPRAAGTSSISNPRCCIASRGWRAPNSRNPPCATPS